MVVEYRVSDDDQASGAYATHQIDAGSCILIEEPFADVTTLNTCAKCFKVINRSSILSRRKPCLKCHEVMYCCKKCKIAHEDVHEAYCAAYKMSSASHRRLSKSQEYLAILTAQCLSRVLLEAEREGICGIHAIYNSQEDFYNVDPDKWLFDDVISKLLFVGGPPPIEPTMVDLAGMMHQAGQIEVRCDTLNNVKDFLFLTKRTIRNGVSAVDGWSPESLEACLTICDALLRRWLCTCASKWSDKTEDKLRIVTAIMRTVLNYGIYTEIRWPSEFISTQMPELLPTNLTNLTKINAEPMPLDRRKSGVIEEHITRACDAYLPSIAAFNKSGAYGIWPKVSMLTHSCEPNCYVYWLRNRAVVVTLRRIEEGERLTIAKCSLLLPYPSRKLILESRYGFACHCSRCRTRGQITLQDVDSITRDLAPVIPDEGIINALALDPISYINIDFGLCATRQQQQLCVFEADVDTPMDQGGTPAPGKGAFHSYTPETTSPPMADDRRLSFNNNPMLKLPTLTMDGSYPSPDVMLANCEISLLSSLRGTLKHQTSARSFHALCNATSATLENRLNPLSLYLYEIRREMDQSDWRVVAKQLVFYSFIYRRCEGHLDRVEQLERLGLLIKKDYYTKWRTVIRKKQSGVPPTKINYAGGAQTDKSSTHTRNLHTVSSMKRSIVAPSAAGTLQPPNAGLLVPLTDSDREVIAEALRCIFREVQFGYQNLFGSEFGRTKLAMAILAELTK